jgi:putative DNA primase/helicase
MLDRVVAAKRAELGLDDGDGKLQGHAISFPEPEPWLDPVVGEALLDDIANAIRRHVVLSDHARDAAALWVLHTHLINCFFISPRAGVCSPVKGCAKSLLLDVLTHLVWRPQLTANVTPAAIFRVIEAHQPTLLIDEADTFLYDNDGLRGVLNGNRRSSQVLRTVGDQHEVRAFATYSACAIALIGSLPDTLHDRAIGIDLKRRLRSETIEPYRPDRAGHLDVLARKEVRWAADNAERVAATEPEMPAGIINREADNWRPLLAIADVAGGDWPDRARKAAKAAHVAATDDDASLLELLLGDLRAAFGTDKATEMIEIASAELVKTLVAVEGRPWAEMGKARKPMTQNRLARMLKPLGIAPRQIGPEDGRLRGYVLADFMDAFGRYLAPLPGEGGSQPSSRPERDEIRTSDISQPSSRDPGWTVAKSQKSNNDGLLDGWTVAKGGSGRNARVRSDELPYDGPVVPVPDQGPDPLGAHGEPVTATRCAHCGRPGGNRVGLGDGTEVHLHRDCEVPFKEKSQ